MEIYPYSSPDTAFEDQAAYTIAAALFQRSFNDSFQDTYNKLSTSSLEDSIQSDTIESEVITQEVNEGAIAGDGLGMFAKISKKLRSNKLISTARSESKDSGLVDKVLLATSLAGYALELSPANEWAVAKIGKEALEQVAANGNIALSAAVVGGSVAAFSLIEHTFLGQVMNRNIRKFPETIGVISGSKFGKSDVLRNSEDRNIAGRFTNAFFVGAASVNLEDSITDPDFITEDKDTKRTLNSAALVAAGTLTLGTLAGGGIQYALNEGNIDLGYRILGHVTNPLIWAGLFAAGRLNDYRKNRAARIKLQ